MRRASAIVVGLAGVGLGVLVSLMGFNTSQSLRASTSDRYQDYVMCTGAVTINPRLQTDGVWMLDYRSGKLLGTVIDKSQGKILDWTEVDLAVEFELKPLQDVHFIMTTGYVAQGFSALYIAETVTGKFGVYSMGPGGNNGGMMIRRHDMSTFRKVQPSVQPAGAVNPNAGMMPGMPGTTTMPLPGTPLPTPPGGMGVNPVPARPVQTMPPPQAQVPTVPGYGQPPGPLPIPSPGQNR